MPAPAISWEWVYFQPPTVGAKAAVMRSLARAVIGLGTPRSVVSAHFTPGLAFGRGENCALRATAGLSAECSDLTEQDK